MYIYEEEKVLKTIDTQMYIENEMMNHTDATNGIYMIPYSFYLAHFQQQRCQLSMYVCATLAICTVPRPRRPSDMTEIDR